MSTEYVCIRDLAEKSRSLVLVHSVFENKQNCFVEICIGALANRCGTTNRTSKYNQHLIGSVDRLDVSDRRFACRNLVVPFWKRRRFVRRVRVFSPGIDTCARIESVTSNVSDRPWCLQFWFGVRSTPGPGNPLDVGDFGTVSWAVLHRRLWHDVNMQTVIDTPNISEATAMST